MGALNNPAVRVQQGEGGDSNLRSMFIQIFWLWNSMGHGVRCAIPHFCIFITDTQRVSPNLEPESALDASC